MRYSFSDRFCIRKRFGSVYLFEFAKYDFYFKRDYRLGKANTEKVDAIFVLNGISVMYGESVNFWSGKGAYIYDLAASLR